MENRTTVESIDVRQMLFNICGEELAGMMSYDEDVEVIGKTIAKIESKSGYKIAKVLQKIEGDLTVQ